MTPHLYGFCHTCTNPLHAPSTPVRASTMQAAPQYAALPNPLAECLAELCLLTTWVFLF